MNLLLFFGFLCTVSAMTNMYFQNLCDHEFPVIRTIELYNRTWTSVEVVLKPNETKNTSYPLSFQWPNMNFRANYTGKTAAEFFLNTGGYDFYGIDIGEGFDNGMKIVPDDGFNVSCYSDNCTDGIKTPEDWRSKMRWTIASESDFTITFCAPVEAKNVRMKHTAMFFRNQCRKTIVVVDIYKGRSGKIVHELRPGFYWMTTDGVEGSFKAGFNGTTKVDVDQNRYGIDYYSINIEDGFDYPVRVGAEGGEVLTCRDSNCSDGIHNHMEYDEKVRKIPTAGTIHITWCPFW